MPRSSKFISPGGLGRRIPVDFKHVEKYPLRALGLTTSMEVNKILELPFWHWTHDQGNEGACEGFGNTMMMAVLNMAQRRAANTRPYTVRYDPWWLWDEAKLIDGWDDTNPGDDNGTSGVAAAEVMRKRGLVRYKYTSTLLSHILNNPTCPDLTQGIDTYRWATDVDQMRAGLSQGLPIALGINWYENFDDPVQHSDGSWWIGESNLGQIRGGHCVCVYGASDRRQAFRVKNSWGRSYPLIWVPYATMSRLLVEQGEACLVTDR